MGGNALSCASVRLTKSNYDRLSVDCLAKLRALYPGKRVEALSSYRAKADFGDCDILVEGGGHYDPHQAAAAIGAVEVVRNGPVTSVGVLVRPDEPYRDGNVFQVDLIKMEAEAFSFAMSYFGHGDAGNLLGRIAHAQSVSLRHDGLVFMYREGDYKFREIMLTREFSEALPFMGYDPAVLAAGFETPEDIYRYVASSPYFNRDIFLLENRNATARVRDKKRVMYTQFLKWCEAHPELPAYQYPEDKSVWLPRIVAFFPGFAAAYAQAQADVAVVREVKARFNGELAAQVTGLQGNELGALMQRIKASFPSVDALRDFVLASTPGDVKFRMLEAKACLAVQGLYTEPSVREGA